MNKFEELVKDTFCEAFEVYKELRADGESENDARNEAMDRLYEAIDGHATVIYTAEAEEAYKQAPNPNAFYENFGARELGEACKNAGRMPWEQLLYASTSDIAAELLEESIREFEEQRKAENPSELSEE